MSTPYRTCERCGMCPDLGARACLTEFVWKIRKGVVLLSRVLCDECAEEVTDAVNKCMEMDRKP